MLGRRIAVVAGVIAIVGSAASATGATAQPRPQPDQRLAPEAVRAIVSKACAGAEGGYGCSLVKQSREVLRGDVVEYNYVVKVGPDSHDVIWVHRVVRETKPGVPEPTTTAVMMLHGDTWGFDAAFAGEEGRLDRVPNVASYLAENDVDVWGMDERWVTVPMHTSGKSFMHSWGGLTDVRDLRVATDMERAMRGATGSGYGPTALLGWSHGGPQIYAYAAYETTLAPEQRNVDALIPVDTLLRYAPEDETSQLHNCQYFAAVQALYRQGKEAVDLRVFRRLGQAALLHPGKPSRPYPGYTNRQAAIIFMGSDYRSFTPWFHYNAPILDGAVPVDLAYSPPERIFGFLQHAAPWESLKERVVGFKTWCGRPMSMYDHVGDVTVPVLYIGAAGGIGTLGEYSLGLLGSTDTSSLVVRLLPEGQEALDFAHVDLFQGSDAQDLVWSPLLAWLVAH